VGAIAMAEKGRKHVEILLHYFPKAQVEPVYGK
jgi:peptidoglycan hydrolase-like amidase